MSGSLWLIGGLDPTGGAGVGRDEATAIAFAPALPRHVVITSYTEQGDGRPARGHAVAATHLREALAQLDRPLAIKLGLLPASLVEIVDATLAEHAAPCVLDPVLRASDGGDMGASVEALRGLVRRVGLVTPNRDEVLAMFGCAPAAVTTAMLRPWGDAAWLLKDCEPGPRVRDRLLDADGETSFVRPRVMGPDPRGTGCALATAIACGLAGGHSLVAACRDAIAWLDDARTRVTPGPDGRAHLA